jgi:hypothetical protein
VEGTNTGHENGEAMASVGVGLTVMLGHGYWLWVLHFMCEASLCILDIFVKNCQLGASWRSF